MRSLLYTIFSVGSVSAAALAPRDVISSNARDSTYAQSFGKVNQLTTVNSGFTYWLSGGGTHNFYGNLDNSGNIIISQTDYLKQNPYAGGQTADFVGSTSLNGNLINRAGGSISLNDYGSASAPTYDWYLHTMENRGSLQFCGRGDTGGSTYQLYCDETCYNYGVIDFEQYTRNLGASFVWRNDVIGANAGVNIYNEGAFRLVNVVYHSVQNVLGSGCWVIDDSSVLYLEDGSGVFQNPNRGPTFPNQKIYFTDADSPSGRYQTLHMDTAVYSQNSDFGPQVYGFGGNRAIEFYETIKSFSYANGVLTVVFVSNNRVNIKIGTGYDSNSFYNARNPQHYNLAGYNAIFYRGSAPSQSVPDVCQVSLGKCTDPEKTAGVSSSTTTSTRAATSSTTGSTTASTTAVATTAVSSSTKAISSSTTTRASSTTAASSSTTPAKSSSSTTTCSTTSSTAITTASSSSSSFTTKVITSSTVAPSSSTTTSVATTAYTTPSTTTAVTTRATSAVTSSSAATTSATTSSVIGNGPCANGAPLSSTYVASNGDVYGVCLNTDFPGPNITPVGGIQTAQQCAEACSKQPGCIAGSLLRESQTCYLKDTRISASPNNGVDSVFKISSGPTSSTTSSRAATSTSSSMTTAVVSSSTTAAQSTTTSASTTSSAASSSTSVISSTTTSARTTTASFTSLSSTVTTSATTSRVISTTSATGTGRCADGRGPDRTYTAFNGDVYGVCLNTDFAGPNLGDPVSSISSPESCADVCSRTAGCIAGSLQRGSQLCYLKNVNNAPVSNSGVDSVYKISSGPGGSSTTASTSASTTRVSSSAPSSSTTSTVASTTTARTSTTTVSSTATSASTSNAASSTTTRTSSTTASSSTTNAVPTTTSRATTTTMTTTTSTSATTSATATGRCANGKGPDATYTATNGDVYGVCYNTDFAGPNLGNPVSGITTTNQCAEACSRTSGCIAGSLLRGSQLCYLKDVNNAPVVNDGVDSVYKISSGPGGSTTTSVSSTTTKVSTTTAVTTSFTTTKVVTSLSTTTVTATAPATTSGCSWVCVPHKEL